MPATEKTYHSEVDGYRFPYLLSDNRAYAIQRNLKGLSLIKFWLKIGWHYRKADKRLKETLNKGICYYGPFKGEFGHMTAHTAPFLMYLHKQGVKIIYCGMQLHMPLLVDENGKSIIHDFRPLRDFFAEVSPKSNSTVPPPDVQQEIKKFEDEARTSGYPFWNIGDNFYYWFIHRHWLLNGHTQVYHLEKFYKTKEQNACCIFPRSKGAKVSHNNGEQWDYDKVIGILRQYFDTVYVLGHPSQVLNINASEGVVPCITADNARIFECVANSRLLVTQHSGVNNLGEYLNTPVLIIYKGGQSVSDIGSMNNTLRFRHALGNRHLLAFAFNEEQIAEYARKVSRSTF